MTTITADLTALFDRVASAHDDAERAHWLALAADELEEHDHPLADCVRLVLPGALVWLAPAGGAVRRPHSVYGPGWTRPEPDGVGDVCSSIPVPVWKALEDCGPGEAGAYLALAQALAPLVPWHDRRPRRSPSHWWWHADNACAATLPGDVLARLSGNQNVSFGSEREAMLALLAAVER